MNDRRRAGKPQTIDTIVTTVTNEHGWSEDIYFKLATIGKAVCLNSRLNSKRQRVEEFVSKIEELILILDE